MFCKLIIFVFLFLQICNANAAEYYGMREIILLGRKAQEKTMQELKTEGNKLTGQGVTDDSGKYVFISFAMPESALNALIRQAKEEKFIPVMRGFKDGSYKKTAEALQQIIKETAYGIIIDPELFKEFDVKVIPTFVSVSEIEKMCLPNTTCLPRKHNKLSGNVTVTYALEQLTKAGDRP